MKSVACRTPYLPSTFPESMCFPALSSEFWGAFCATVACPKSEPRTGPNDSTGSSELPLSSVRNACQIDLGSCLRDSRLSLLLIQNALSWIKPWHRPATNQNIIHSSVSESSTPTKRDQLRTLDSATSWPRAKGLREPSSPTLRPFPKKMQSRLGRETESSLLSAILREKIPVHRLPEVVSEHSSYAPVPP